MGIDNYSGMGPGSPFEILRNLNAKIAVLDLLDNDSMTFYHHIEEICEVDYRYLKEFSGLYIDANGTKTLRKYSMYVRDLDLGVERHLNPMGKMLWDNGLYTGDKPGVSSGLRVCFANKVFDFVKGVIEKGDAYGNLYLLKN